MKAVALKIKTYNGRYTPEVTIVNTANLGHRVLRLLLVATAVLAISYLFILGTMVYNILERKGLEARARVLSSEVAALELSYLTLVSKIDLPYSYSLGFREVKGAYASRQTLGFSAGAAKSGNEI